MKIYEIVYEAQAGKDGFAREYFLSKRARLKGIASLKREHAEETVAAQARMDAGEVYPAFPTYNVDNIMSHDLTITGTCQEMVLWALRYNA